MNQYGFYGRLKKEFPSQIIIDVSENCNLACVHCPHANFKKSKVYNGNFLDIELNNKMVDEVKKYGQGMTQQIRYTAAGEPLLHPKILEMIKYAVDKSETLVSITTNGTLLDKDKIKGLLDVGIDLIDISIDAYSDDIYSKIRINGNLEITRNNVLDLLRERKKRKKRTKVVVSFVEQPLNCHETSDFKRYWEDKGVDYVIIRRLHSAGGAKKNISKKLNITNEERKPCVYPWERIVLNAKGYLDFCPASWLGLSHIIDYSSTSVFEAWQSDFYTKLREAHICNELQNYSACAGCPDWQEIKWPDEARSYGDMIGDFSRDKLKK